MKAVKVKEQTKFLLFRTGKEGRRAYLLARKMVIPLEY